MAMTSDSLPKDINFLFEMGSVRFIDRMWKRFMGVDFANLAEHHFRMFWIAMILASHEKDIDVAKVAKMVMIHDIAESRTGDVDYLARQYVERNEELGIKDMLEGTNLESEFVSLWQEYEAKSSREAKLVKDADNLDVDFELAEQKSMGKRLPEQWNENRQFVSKERLYTATAKKIFASLQTANPHAWHTESRNRRNSGDWAK
jgi:putative hydrolase of HD superfamily